MAIESAVQGAILQYCQLKENLKQGWFLRNNSFSGFIQRGERRGFIKNNKPGAPDILGCYRGVFVGIEVKGYNPKTGKTAGYNQSPAQLKVEEQITKAGGTYLLARSIDDVVELFERIDETHKLV